MTENTMKLNGIYHNFFGDFSNNEKYVLARNAKSLNWKLLDLTLQSIHHIHYYKDECGLITSINIVPRRIGIKPEDIDVEYYKSLISSGIQLEGHHLKLMELGEIYQGKLCKEKKREKSESYLIKIKSLIEKYNKLNENQLYLQNENKN